MLKRCLHYAEQDNLLVKLPLGKRIHNSLLREVLSCNTVWIVLLSNYPFFADILLEQMRESSKILNWLHFYKIMN